MKTFEAPEHHDWTELQATGNWVVCEQIGVITKTRSGIHVPDNARMAVWVAFSVGADVTNVKAGDRVLFINQATHNVDGRLFAIMPHDAIAATLSMPVEAAEPDEEVPEVIPAPKPAPPVGSNGRARIIVPS